MKCPSCGRDGTGRFCEDCGKPLAATSCPSCGGELPDDVKFCHQCGAPTGATPVGAGDNRVAWIALGMAGLALVLAGVALVGAPARPVGSPAAGPPAARSGLAGTAPAPDISNMTPREQADRLFDRIMAAHERGDENEKTFFRDMALQAYALLGGLDADARYHVGLIQTVTGNPAAGLAQADSMFDEVPGHLLGLMLQHTAQGALGNAQRRAELARDFLAGYDEQMGSGREEYLAHQRSLEGFRNSLTVGGRPPGN